eukprot:gene15745-21315_t
MICLHNWGVSFRSFHQLNTFEFLIIRNNNIWKQSFRNFCVNLLNDEDDNKCTPWTLEEDKLLIQECSRFSIEELSKIMKRGIKGTQKRLENLNNPKHKAYARFYGIESLQEISLRPCRDVIERILWDGSLQAIDFSFVYLDRFDGECERYATDVNENVKGKERLLIKAIPEHRILRIKYKERVVWDKQLKLDNVFGSGETMINNLKIYDVINTYEDWLYEQMLEKSQQDDRLNNIQIFCTLDNILMDYNKGVYNIFNKHPAQVSPKILWNELYSNNNFFALLPWTADGLNLWNNLLCPLNVTILTDHNNGYWIKSQKIQWCKEHLGESIHLISVNDDKEKISLCLEKQTNILIDNSLKLKSDWENSGGKFIEYNSMYDTVQQLEQFGLDISFLTNFEENLFVVDD